MAGLAEEAAVPAPHSFGEPDGVVVYDGVSMRQETRIRRRSHDERAETDDAAAGAAPRVVPATVIGAGDRPSPSNRIVTGCDACNDFRDITRRDGVDAILIATPDHWHATIGMASRPGHGQHARSIKR